MAWENLSVSWETNWRISAKRSWRRSLTEVKSWRFISSQKWSSIISYHVEDHIRNVLGTDAGIIFSWHDNHTLHVCWFPQSLSPTLFPGPGTTSYNVSHWENKQKNSLSVFMFFLEKWKKTWQKSFRVDHVNDDLLRISGKLHWDTDDILNMKSSDTLKDQTDS